MAKKSLTVNVTIDGLWETLDKFRDLPKEATDAIRDAAQTLAGKLAADAQTAGRAQGHQAALVASTVKARRDRVPVVVAGGTKRLGRNRKPAFKLLFGSEFGSNRFRQYRPHVGRGSYWFFRTIDDQREEIARQWSAAADDIITRFGEG